jgi:hypothetical protein
LPYPPPIGCKQTKTKGTSTGSKTLEEVILTPARARWLKNQHNLPEAQCEGNACAVIAAANPPAKILLFSRQWRDGRMSRAFRPS